MLVITLPILGPGGRGRGLIIRLDLNINNVTYFTSNLILMSLFTNLMSRLLYIILMSRILSIMSRILR